MTTAQLIHSSADGHLGGFQSLSQTMLQSSCYYLLVTVSQSTSAFTLIPSLEPDKRQGWTLRPFSLLAGFHFLFQSLLIVHSHLTTVTKMVSDLTVQVWPCPHGGGVEAVSFTSPKPKLTVTSLHWDLHTFQVLEDNSVNQVSFQKKTWGSLWFWNRVITTSYIFKD